MKHAHHLGTALLLASLLSTACASGGAGGSAAGSGPESVRPSPAGSGAGGSAAGSGTAGDRAPPEGSAPRIVQPGAPGEAGRTLTDAPLDAVEGASWTDADVRFMQGMIHHHAQALRMTDLVPDRTSDEGFRQMALRMQISQTDEIGIMQSWLRARDLEVPDVGAHHGTLMSMPGMLSEDQMRTLRDARGEDFERAFLQFMIQHHGGALVMVNQLFDTPGAGQESTINFFANEVDADQTIEIRRMQQMLRARG